MKSENKLPQWLETSEEYQPAKSHFSAISFLVRNVKRFSYLSNKIHKKNKDEISLASFIIFMLEIVFLSLSQSLIFIWAMTIVFLFKLAFTDKVIIIKTAKHTFLSIIPCFIILLPLLLFDSDRLNFLFVLKTVVILLRVNIFMSNVSVIDFILLAQKLHVSNSMIFILGMMTKYLKVLNSSLIDQMNAIQIKSVGKMHNPYQIIGEIFGTIYLNSVDISQDVHDAMVARCYTGEFRQVNYSTSKRSIAYGVAKGLALAFTFVVLGR